MGVPALFRWLSKKYPKIVTRVAEDKPIQSEDAEGTKYVIPVDILEANPNGFEMDNLYLDMNGIVHPCTHPEGKPAPETEEDMMLEIFIYTERIVNMIRPRKLLFMAIDGVAPRAKMNQQRSRRFRSAREAREKEDKRQEDIALWEAMGQTVSEDTKNVKSWDSNAITPGTPFMALLATSLRYWVVQKMNNDLGWKNLEVIISDASVPGEGEHKIMDFIRRQRVSPLHDPNTRHVIYGLDADLIMLALATHEPHFRVLREDVFAQENSRACRNCGQEGHYAAQCTNKKPPVDLIEKTNKSLEEAKPFIFLDIAILREYLEMELNVPAPFMFEFERAIDDWVLLIFFVGNDFLPHLPSLEIREGAIDMLVGIWKRELPRMGGYLTDHGKIDLARAQIILDGLSKREEDIFRRRKEGEERQEQNAKRRKLEEALALNGAVPSSISLPPTPNVTFGVSETLTPQTEIKHTQDHTAVRKANLEALKALKPEVLQLHESVQEAPTEAIIQADNQANEDETQSVDMELENEGDPSVTFEVSDVSAPTGDSALVGLQLSIDASTDVVSRGTKRKLEDMEGDDDSVSDGAELPGSTLKVNPDGTAEQADTVRLWEPGFKERYYQQKFKGDYQDLDLRRRIVTHYVEGLVWVLHYYYQGTPSWQWYYPYHFAPFAVDFQDMGTMQIEFQKGTPFKPFEQLMGVFPPDSRMHIPLPLQDLMVNEASPIIQFYPLSFDIDMNGKRMAWQGVALLPFIDEAQLLGAVVPLYSKLTEEEQQRNSTGNNILFVSEQHVLFESIAMLYLKRKMEEPLQLNGIKGSRLAGSILKNPECIPGSTYPSPLDKLEDIESDRSISALYLYPRQVIPHRSKLLPGVIIPAPVLTSADYEHVQRGGRGGADGMRRPGYGDRHHGFHTPESRYRDSPRYGNGNGNSGGYQYSNGTNGRRSGPNTRGEPDYSYGGPSSYRGPPPRGIGRGRPYGPR